LFQVFVEVKNWVQEHMFCADVDYLLDTFVYVGCWPPDCDLVSHVRASIDVTEPLAQPLLRPFSVVIDGQVESFRDGKGGGISTGLMEAAAQDGYVFSEIFDTRGARAHPRVTELGSPSQRWLDASTEPNWWTWLLDWLWFHEDVF
tara:strand:+ start:134 stop:571 length:438 start_codon:yes stop_codon:yes gene_type:complete